LAGNRHNVNRNRLSHDWAPPTACRLGGMADIGLKLMNPPFVADVEEISL
jgi:hypothetical protein